MLDVLGSPKDDSENLFTSRLLLLLEGRPLYNDDLFERVRNRVIAHYLRDLEGHSSDYRPSFLVNDITRYWKTICLNYEHRRKDLESTKHKIRNFKLRFSRLLMCYSFLIDLGTYEAIDREAVVAVANRNPAERLQHACRNGRGASILERALDEYQWFIRCVEMPETLQAQLEQASFRDDARGHADKFGQALYDMLSLSNDNYLRYLVM